MTKGVTKMYRQRMSVISRATAVVALSLFALAECAWGESNCKQAKGDAVIVAVGSGPASGPITNGGDLNGTMIDVFTGGGFPTPDPMIVSFAGDLTITTHQGQLRASAVHFFDLASGVASAQARINPVTSTGRFAGATGFLFFNGVGTTTSPFTTRLEISGQICFAHSNDDSNDDAH
jgi:hypothetical protein